MDLVKILDDHVPEDFDWIYDSPRREDLPHRTEIEEEAL